MLFELFNDTHGYLKLDYSDNSVEVFWPFCYKIVNINKHNGVVLVNSMIREGQTLDIKISNRLNDFPMWN